MAVADGNAAAIDAIRHSFRELAKEFYNIGVKEF